MPQVAYKTQSVMLQIIPWFEHFRVLCYMLTQKILRIRVGTGWTHDYKFH